MFRLQKGVREYLLETYSDLHYTAPNIYDQKVKASQGTVRGNRGLPGLLEYFNVNIYSSSLLNDERLLSPLAKNGKKYYKYRIDSVMGERSAGGRLYDCQQQCMERAGNTLFGTVGTDHVHLLDQDGGSGKERRVSSGAL